MLESLCVMVADYITSATKNSWMSNDLWDCLPDRQTAIQRAKEVIKDSRNAKFFNIPKDTRPAIAQFISPQFGSPLNYSVGSIMKDADRYIDEVIG